MQILINIPEELYKHVRGELAELECQYDYNLTSWNAIHDGTPLPKGHGRLIDADEIIRLTNEIETEDREEELYHLFLKTVLTDAPTIIEADKAETEE